MDAVEAQPQRLGNGVDQQSLCQAWHHQQNVATRKNGGRHFADDVFLAHNDLSHFGEQGFVLGAERVKRGFVVGKIRHSSGASRLLPEDSHARLLGHVLVGRIAQVEPADQSSNQGAWFFVRRSVPDALMDSVSQGMSMAQSR